MIYLYRRTLCFCSENTCKISDPWLENRNQIPESDMILKDSPLHRIPSKLSECLTFYILRVIFVLTKKIWKDDLQQVIWFWLDFHCLKSSFQILFVSVGLYLIYVTQNSTNVNAKTHPCRDFKEFWYAYWA